MPAVSAGLSFEGVSLSLWWTSGALDSLDRDAAFGKPQKGWTSGEQSLAGLEALGGSAVEVAVREHLQGHIDGMHKPMLSLASSAQGIQVRGERSAVRWLVPQGLLGDSFWIRSPKPWPAEYPSIGFRY